MWQDGVYDHTESGLYIAATAAGSTPLATGFLGPVPAGYCWYVEGYTSWVNATRANSLCELFVLSSNALPAGYSSTVGDRTAREDVLSANNGVGPSGGRLPIYVPEGYYLVALWTGLTAADVAQLSTQVTVHLKDPTLSVPKFEVAQIVEAVTPDANEEAETAARDGADLSPQIHAFAAEFATEKVL